MTAQGRASQAEHLAEARDRDGDGIRWGLTNRAQGPNLALHLFVIKFY